jgi:hypothetical protein
MLSSFDEGLSIINENILDHYAINYGLCFINDPLMFSQNIEKYSRLYSNKIVFFHSAPPPTMKKEDLYILSQRLSGYKCIGLIRNSESWNQQNMEYMPYGIPIDKSIDIHEKEFDILILDLKNNKHNKILFDVLKSKYRNMHIVQSLPSNFIDITKMMSKYKICIDIDIYYNLLVAASVGCIGLTAQKSEDEDVISSMEDMDSIVRSVDKYLSTYEVSKTDFYQSYVSQKYNFINFKNNINTIIDTFYKKACIV